MIRLNCCSVKMKSSNYRADKRVLRPWWHNTHSSKIDTKNTRISYNPLIFWSPFLFNFWVQRVSMMCLKLLDCLCTWRSTTSPRVTKVLRRWSCLYGLKTDKSKKKLCIHIGLFTWTKRILSQKQLLRIWSIWWSTLTLQNPLVLKNYSLVWSTVRRWVRKSSRARMQKHILLLNKCSLKFGKCSLEISVIYANGILFKSVLNRNRWKLRNKWSNGRKRWEVQFRS